jgi:polar amino acid transport system substrate-binding protein
MKHLKIIILLLLVSFMNQTVYSEEIKVGFEPLPPLIIDKDNGYTIQMLKEIEKQTDLKFLIKIMPYNRVKFALEKGEIDLAGHTPYQMETPEFYEYAVDVDWYVTTKIDFYSKKKENLSGDLYKSLGKIGTLRGNEQFFSEVFGIPVKNFFLNELDNLVKMMNSNRIDGIFFERSASMSTIQKLNVKDIHYKLIDDSIKASFAVNKNSNGMRLKTIIENAIKNTDQKAIFKDYFHYIELPDQGIVTP